MTAMRGMMRRSGPMLMSMVERSVWPSVRLVGREKEGRPDSPASERVRTGSERSSS